MSRSHVKGHRRGGVCVLRMLLVCYFFLFLGLGRRSATLYQHQFWWHSDTGPWLKSAGPDSDSSRSRSRWRLELCWLGLKPLVRPPNLLRVYPPKTDRSLNRLRCDLGDYFCFFLPIALRDFHMWPGQTSSVQGTQEDRHCGFCSKKRKSFFLLMGCG